MIDHRVPDSFLRRFDPRVKLVSALLLIVGILLTPDRGYPAYPLLWALIASIGITGQLGVGRLALRGTTALPFVLISVTMLFTVPGAPLIHIASLIITDAGLIHFVGVLLKTWLAMQVSLILALTTPVVDLLWAAGQIGVPRPLVQIMTMMVRYLLILRDEASRLIAARAARSARLNGWRGGGSILWRGTVAGRLIGNLFLRSTERGERVYAAMLARGYIGRIMRASAPPLNGSAIMIGALPVLAEAAILLAVRQ